MERYICLMTTNHGKCLFAHMYSVIMLLHQISSEVHVIDHNFCLLETIALTKDEQPCFSGNTYH